MAVDKLEKKEKEIFTLEGSGKKLAVTNVNRKIDNSVVRAKMKSIEVNALLTPIIVVDATVVTNMGYDVFDADTNEKMSNATDYLVIVDGQHRYRAIKELNKKDKYYDIWLMYPLNEKTIISNLIMEINTTAVNWKNDNYIEVLSKLRPDDKGLAFLQKYSSMKHKRTKKGEIDDGLPNNGYGLSVLSKYLTFGTEINREYLYKMARISAKKLPDNIKIDRAEKIIETGLEVGFTHKFLSSRYFIDWIIYWSRYEYTIDKILGCVKQDLTPDKVKHLMDDCDVENYIKLFDEAIELH